MSIFRDLNDIIWLWHKIKSQRYRVVQNCAIGVVRIGFSLAFVYASKHIVDIATGSVAGNIYHWVGIMIGVMLAQVLTSLWNARVKEKNRIELTNLMRSRFFAKAMNSEWTGRDKLHSGDVMSRLGEDVRTVSETVCDRVPQILLSAVQLLAASTVLFMLGKELLWVVIAIMPIALLVSKLYYRKLRSINDKLRNQEGGIQSHMQENLLKRILIICMGRQEDSLHSLALRQDELHDTVITRVNYSTRSHFFIQFGFMAGYFATFCWGAFGIMAGTVTYGMMTAFLQLVNQVQVPIVNMGRNLPALIQTATAINRLKEIDAMTEMTDEVMESDVNLKYSAYAGLRLKRLSFTYPNNQEPTISDLSFDFRPGQHTAIVGATGEGKSTLTRLVLGLLRPDSGMLEIYDRDGNTTELRRGMRKLFCYVPQGNSLISGTVRDNLLLGNPQATDEEMIRALNLAAADFVFERENGIDSSCDEQGGGLSEGQAQRIAIARALLQPGTIYIFDEACSALDSVTKSLILNNLDNELRGKTVIWITHDEMVSAKMDATLRIVSHQYNSPDF